MLNLLGLRLMRRTVRGVAGFEVVGVAEAVDAGRGRTGKGVGFSAAAGLRRRAIVGDLVFLVCKNEMRWKDGLSQGQKIGEGVVGGGGVAWASV